MCRVYGYARISRKEQSIERQLRNIEKAFPGALMIQEAYTGTKIEGRAQLEKLLRTVKPGDTIVFDSVSRMSRNAAEGVTLYEQLYQRGVNLVFLKEPGINTETYKRAMTDGGIPMTGTNVDFILEGVNRYMMALARDQVRLAFEQAQKEVDDLHQRTREGIETARLKGKQIGQQEGLMFLTPHMCVMDYPTIEYKGGKLLRTKTLGAGGDCCDFHVVKGEK